MADEAATPMKQIIGSLVPSTASGLAKASPGISVGGLYLAGIQIEDWVSILTSIYLFIMMFGAIPKVFNTIRFFRQKWVDAFTQAAPILQVTVIRNNSKVHEKMQKGAKDEKATGSSRAES